MLFRNLLPFEIVIMEKFVAFKIREMVSILYKDKGGYIPRMYFLQFPSQSQVVEEILPAIEKLESTTDKSKDLLEIEALEKHLITVLKTNLYSSYDKETLIEAFRVIDSEKNGYLDLHTFYLFMKSYGVSFIKDQIKEMEQFLLENDNELLEPLGICRDDNSKEKHLPTTTRKFYYENYVRKVLSDDEKHYEMILDEYNDFYDTYKETGSFPQPPVIEIVHQEIKPVPVPVPEPKPKNDEEAKKKEEKGDSNEESKKNEEDGQEGQKEQEGAKEGEEENENQEEQPADKEGEGEGKEENVAENQEVVEQEKDKSIQE